MCVCVSVCVVCYMCMFECGFVYKCLCVCINNVTLSCLLESNHLLCYTYNSCYDIFVCVDCYKLINRDISGNIVLYNEMLTLLIKTPSNYIMYNIVYA